MILMQNNSLVLSGTQCMIAFSSPFPKGGTSTLKVEGQLFIWPTFSQNNKNKHESMSSPSDPHIYALNCEAASVAIPFDTIPH